MIIMIIIVINGNASVRATSVMLTVGCVSLLLRQVRPVGMRPVENARAYVYIYIYIYIYISIL